MAEKEKDPAEESIEQKNHLFIPEIIGGLGVAFFGIFLLLITFLISLIMGSPEKFEDFE